MIPPPAQSHSNSSANNDLVFASPSKVSPLALSDADRSELLRSDIDIRRNVKHHSLHTAAKEVAMLATAGAAQILGKEVDANAHSKMLDDLAAQL